MKLENVRAIVTGGARGMGAHFALRLAEAGASVAVGDVDTEGLAALADRGSATDGAIFTRELDVTSGESASGFVAWAREKLGSLNTLINNAGIIRDGLLVKKDRNTGEVTTLSDEQWNAVLAVNLTGATRMVRETVASMVRAGDGPGVVINISSVSRHGNRGQSNYVAAKAALAANTVTWNREFARFGVRVSAIAPGMVETPMTQGMNQKARDVLVSKIPVGRIGVPEDLWLAVKFSIECDYFAGRTLDVDGGLVMA